MRVTELFIITGVFATLSFALPVIAGGVACTAMPTQIASWSSQEQALLDKLVQFNCREGEYNQLASLYLVDADTALQQLYHFLGSDDGVDGSSTFSTGCLLLFVVPYLVFAILTTGTFCPAGLFVPTLLSGAGIGRIIGHILHVLFPHHVMDPGSYALIGSGVLAAGVSDSRRLIFSKARRSVPIKS